MKSTVKHFQLPLWAGTEQNLPSTWAVIHTYTWLRPGLTGKGEGGTTWNKGRHAHILLVRILGGIWFWDVTIVHHPNKPRDKEDPKNTPFEDITWQWQTVHVFRVQPRAANQRCPQVATVQLFPSIEQPWLLNANVCIVGLSSGNAPTMCFSLFFLLSCTEHLYTKSSLIYQEKKHRN